jgi:DcuC family C4-dicarboxylate transporter
MTMIGVLLALLVTIWVGYLILKSYKPQTILLLGGIILMVCAILLNGKPILSAKASTGLIWFDIFEFIKNTLSSRAAGLGLMIMGVAGFAKYMDHIGASKVLVNLAVRPLAKLRSPYLVLSAGYMLGQVLALFIPSASGLGVLLMVTMYPVLVSLGVSRLSAVAMIGTTQSMDIGPGSGNSALSATNAGMDVASYFVNYQIPVGLCVMATVAVLHFIVQKWFDNRAGHLVHVSQVAATETEQNLPPASYALLPIIPLALILGFSPLLTKAIKMDVVTAMLISTLISMVFEYFRYRDAKKVFASLQVFFDGMGVQFATVVTLIVAGETFAQGLTSIGAIDSIIKSAQSLGLGGGAMTVVMTAIISVSAVIMGSGNAPFFAFAALAPVVAGKMAIAPVAMLLPMQFASSIARSVSPITAVIVAVSGIANVSPIDVVKRTAIPMAGAMLANLIASAILI